MRLSKLSAWAVTVRVDALIFSHWRQKQRARTTWPPKNASRYDILTRQKERENDQRLRRWNWTGSLSLFFFLTRQQLQQIREEPENMEARASVTGLLRWDVIRICHRILTSCSSHRGRTEEIRQLKSKRWRGRTTRNLSNCSTRPTCSPNSRGDAWYTVCWYVSGTS